MAFPGLNTTLTAPGVAGLAYYSEGAYQTMPVGPLQGQRGYWAYATQATQLTWDSQGEAESLALQTGWNLVSSGTSTPIPIELPTVRASDSSASTTLEPGVAYWVFAPSPITIPYSTEVTPKTATIQVTGTQVFTLAGATFKSDPESVATINAQGIATGVTPGTATITATLNGKTSTATLTVTGPPAPVIPAPLPTPIPLSFRNVENFGTLSGIAGSVTVGAGPIKFNNHPVEATNMTMLGVATDGTSYVAVGHDGRLETSPDGRTWTTVRAGGVSLYGVTWSGTQWVVVGDEGTVLTSPDAVTWTAQASGTNAQFTRVKYLNGLYVAVGGGRDLRTSPDAVTWTNRAGGVQLYGVAYGNGIYVAGGAVGITFTSANGVNWTQSTWGSGTEIRDITFDGTQFVAVGTGGVVKTSVDGLTWTQQTSSTSNALNSIDWNGSLLRAVGDSGIFITSPDGVTWTQAYTPQPTWLGVATDGKLFVQCGQNGGLRTSTDGTTWTTLPSPFFSVSFTAVKWAAGQWVMLSDHGGIFTSTDGVNWTVRVTPTISSSNLKAVAYGNGTWVAVGFGATIYTSTDAVTWTQRSSASSNRLLSVAYGPAGFVALDHHGEAQTSPDGMTWTFFGPVTDNAVAYGNGLYVAGGYNGIFTSSDLVTWTPRTSTMTASILGLTWAPSGWVAVGADGQAATSTDGLTWTRLPIKNGRNYLASVAGHASRYVIVGESGTIITSP